MKTYGAFLAAVLCCGTACAQNFGVVDINRLASQSSYSEQLQQSMMQDFQDEHQALLTLEKNYQEQVKAFEQEADFLSPQAREEREEQLFAAQDHLRAEHTKFSEQINERREHDMNHFLERVKKEVSLLAQVQDLTFVVPSEVVLYNQGAVDLTERVMEHLSTSES